MNDRSITPALAVSFLLNADAVVQHFPLPADAEDLALEIAAVLDQVPANQLPNLAVALTSEALASMPDAGGIIDQITDQAVTRSLESADATVVTALLRTLQDNWLGVAMLVVALRSLGGNRLKVGSLDLETKSIYQDLAGFLKFWSGPGNGPTP